jgi:hypothetical protein
MTNKQTQTLLLFAQNCAIPIIAREQRVATSTVRTRLKQISKSYPAEFDNALSIRRANQRIKEGIKTAKRQAMYGNIWEDKPISYRF